MPNNRRYSRRKGKNNKYQPKQKVRFQRKNAKYQLANKVELVRPITLKPTSVMKKFVYYNTAEIKNALGTATGSWNGQQCQFIQCFLNSPKCITALFANVDSQGSNLTKETTIDDLYAMPYTQVRKITGGQSNNGDMSGNTKSASIVLKYSPKRFNNIKDIRDNSSFHALLNIGAGTGRLPPERDRVCFGILPVSSNPVSVVPCVKVLLQYKHEATILFSEPFNNNNIGVAVPAEAYAEDAV